MDYLVNTSRETAQAEAEAWHRQCYERGIPFVGVRGLDSPAAVIVDAMPTGQPFDSGDIYWLHAIAQEYCAVVMLRDYYFIVGPLDQEFAREFAARAAYALKWRYVHG